MKLWEWANGRLVTNLLLIVLAGAVSWVGKAFATQEKDILNEADKRYVSKVEYEEAWREHKTWGEACIEKSESRLAILEAKIDNTSQRIARIEGMIETLLNQSHE